MRGKLPMALLVAACGLAQADVDAVHQNTINARGALKSNIGATNLPVTLTSTPAMKTAMVSPKPSLGNAKITNGPTDQAGSAKSAPQKGTAVGSEKPEGTTGPADHTGIKSETTGEKKGAGATVGNISFGEGRPNNTKYSMGKVGPDFHCRTAQGGRQVDEAAIRGLPVGTSLLCYNGETKRTETCTSGPASVADTLMSTGQVLHPSNFSATAVYGGTLPTAAAVACDSSLGREGIGDERAAYYVGDANTPNSVKALARQFGAHAVIPAFYVLAMGSIAGGGGGGGSASKSNSVSSTAPNPGGPGGPTPPRPPGG